MIKYLIIASQNELEDIGISYELTGLIGTLIDTLRDGWLQLEINHDGFTNEFDFPPTYLEKV